jgi:hypothetical protein
MRFLLAVAWIGDEHILVMEFLVFSLDEGCGSRISGECWMWHI